MSFPCRLKIRNNYVKGRVKLWLAPALSSLLPASLLLLICLARVGALASGQRRALPCRGEMERGRTCSQHPPAAPGSNSRPGRHRQCCLVLSGNCGVCWGRGKAEGLRRDASGLSRGLSRQASSTQRPVRHPRRPLCPFSFPSLCSRISLQKPQERYI